MFPPRLPPVFAEISGIVCLRRTFANIIRRQLPVLAALSVLGVIESFANSADDDADFANHLNSGIVLAQNGQYEQARSEFNKASRAQPQDPRPYLNLGITYRTTGDVTRAIDNFTRAIELSSRDKQTRAQGYARRGEVYLLQEKEYTKAVADLDKAIELEPGDPDLIGKRGYAYSLMGEYQKAIADYASALRLKPGDPKALQGMRLAQEKLAASVSSSKRQLATARATPAQQSYWQDWYNLTQKPENNSNGQALIEEAARIDRAAAASAPSGVIILDSTGTHVWGFGEITLITVLLVALVGAVCFIAGRRGSSHETRR